MSFHFTETDEFKDNWTYKSFGFLSLISLIVVNYLGKEPDTPHRIFAILSYLLLFGSVAFCALGVLTREFFLWNYKRGGLLFKRGLTEKAIRKFLLSYDFLQKHRWIDENRFFTLLSSSKISYREKALCNIANCYLTLENNEKAKHYFAMADKLFPNGEAGKRGLRLLAEISQI